MLLGCADDAPATETLEQPLGTAWLLELDGAPAGWVSAVSAADGKPLCSSQALTLALGLNMSSLARDWLNAPVNQKPLALSGAVTMATTQQQLRFSNAQVAALDFPRASATDGTPSVFTVRLSAPSSASCKTLTSAEVAKKTQQAATFAARSSTPKDTGVLLGTVLASPTPDTRGSWTGGKLSVGTGAGQALYDWIEQAFDDAPGYRAGVISAAGLYEVPRDASGAPIIIVGFGPLVAAQPTDGGAGLTFAQAYLGVPLPDGGFR